MGWTGQPVDHRPTSQELNRMVEDWTRGDGYRNIGRSGWMNHGSHVYLLTEREKEGAVTRFITLVLVQYRKSEIRYKIMDETEGPNLTDCPMRLIKALEGHPPVNGRAGEWRNRVVQFHRQMKQRKRILRILRKNYPGGERRVVLDTGETVTYHQGNYRGRREVSAYAQPGEGLLVLEPGRIDAEATLTLWDQDEAGTQRR